MNQYLTQGIVQVIVHANQPLNIKITTTNKFYTHNCSILIPYQHKGDLILLPTKEKCLLNYDQKTSLNFLTQQLPFLINIAGNTVTDIILEKNNNTYTIIGFNYPASPTYINKELNKQTTSLQEKQGLNYDGKHAYHWNWCFGVFPDDADVMDTY